MTLVTDKRMLIVPIAPNDACKRKHSNINIAFECVCVCVCITYRFVYQ